MAQVGSEMQAAALVPGVLMSLAAILARARSERQARRTSVWAGVRAVGVLDALRMVIAVGVAVSAPLVTDEFWPVAGVLTVIGALLALVWIVQDLSYMREESAMQWLASLVLATGQVGLLYKWMEVHQSDEQRSSEHLVLASLQTLFFLTSTCWNRDVERLRNKVGESTSSMVTPLLGDSEGENALEKGAKSRSSFQKVSPEETAGMLSWLSFSWISGLLQLGAKRPLEKDDLFRCAPDAEVDNFIAPFEQAYGRACEEERIRRAEARAAALLNKEEEKPVDVKSKEGGSDERSDKDKVYADGKPFRFIRALHASPRFRWNFYLSGFLTLAAAVFKFVAPALLNKLIKRLQKVHDTGKKEGDDLDMYALTAGLFLSGVGLSLLNNHKLAYVLRAGYDIKAMSVYTIFKKSLMISPGARQLRTTGQTVNLVSTDSERFEWTPQFFWTALSAPIEIVISLVFLWKLVGVATLAAIGFLVLVALPSSSFAASKLEALETVCMGAKDKRVKVVTEVLSNIKAIKLYGWEDAFREEISRAREAELAAIRRQAQVNVLAGSVVFQGIPVLLTIVTIGTFALLGGVLDPATAFTTMSILGMLRMPMGFLPHCLSALASALVSFRRVDSFCNSDEVVAHGEGSIRDPPTMTGTGASSSTPLAVDLQGLTFFWDDACKVPALRDVNVKIPVGTFAVIAGEVGSGKSGFVQGLVGDLKFRVAEPGTTPAPLVSGSIAYCPQQPWIQNCTVRDNIIFGLPFDQEWYDKVVHACCLEADFRQLTSGDSTEIGERGINLSGGQKARISLARAVYSGADILVLESCLEAVDAHVAKAIWDRCFLGILRQPSRVSGRKRTILLVTHSLKFLADMAIVLRDGRIVEQGDYSKLARDPSSELVRLTMKEATNEGGDKQPSSDASSDGAKSATPSEQGAANVHQDGTEAPASDAQQQQPAAAANATGGGLISDEGKASGKVTWDVYNDYLRALGGVRAISGIFMACLFAMLADLGSTRWVAHWSEMAGGSGVDPLTNDTEQSALTLGSRFPIVGLVEDESSVNGTSSMDRVFLLNGHTFLYSSSNGDTDLLGAPSTNTGFFLAIFAALGISKILFDSLTNLGCAYAGIRASRIIHDQLVNSVTRARMAFFDTTPLGRVLNRFTKDMYSVDNKIYWDTVDVLSLFFSMVGTLGFIVWVTPAYGIALPFLFIGYRQIQQYYLASSRELKRINSLLVSPLVAHFTETIEGGSSIRAYKVEPRFIGENAVNINDVVSTLWLYIQANRWLSVRVEVLGQAMVAVACVLVVANVDSIPAAVGAMTITNSQSISMYLNWIIRCFSEVEVDMVAIERVGEYITQVAPEETDEELVEKKEAAKELAPNWPSKGEIVFENVHAAYRPGLDNVLKGLSYCVRGGEKVGIVGRTGSGKSSTMLMLLRIFEATEGRILIDGVDLKTIPLSLLRSKLALVPQDPVIFDMKNVRGQLDPENKFSDDEIFQALEATQLGKVFPRDQGKAILDGPLPSLSFGQRQLFCITRAILRKNKIVLCDEASSSLDHASDEIVQHAIATQFKDCTILTIAHRLQTVASSDKILVMDNGRMAEYASPAELLKSPASMYSQLVNKMNGSSA